MEINNKNTIIEDDGITRAIQPDGTVKILADKKTIEKLKKKLYIISYKYIHKDEYIEIPIERLPELEKIIEEIKGVDNE